MVKLRRLYAFIIGIFLLGTLGILPGRALDTQLLHLPQILQAYTYGPGAVTGKVVNAMERDKPIAGVSICDESGSFCTLTDDAGYFSLSPFNPGSYVFTTNIEDYFPVSR